MAKVSLRIYTREIESLIDQGGTNEAMAHCRHILKTFPKHLETYRLLGKSYLESHRYGEAVDVFSRVLMSVPDDFVSHVGMSIINDEQNRLDDSIWHMERAFESQPSNPAIQGELQRLYGRRDGMEPPKVRMTRGALAHMYVQGELYPQAIAEIRAVLGQDPQRADMQVLLARAYFKSGQKADSSDICAQLLKRYPYCFDANRIMVELLPSTINAAENTQVYRTRVGELDPYAAVSKGPVFQSNEVADNAVSLERLEYSGEDVPLGQEWSSSLGIGLGASSAAAIAATSSPDQPDWLKGFSPSPSDAFASAQPFGAVDAAPGADSPPAAEIPDFLRSAGWGESSGGAEQPVSFFDSAEPAVGGALAPAEIPDWLQGQVPSEAAQSSGLPLTDSTPAPATETPDWLSGLGAQSAEAALSQSNEAPDWLSDLGAAKTEESAAATPTTSPDWLNGPRDAQSAEQSAATPANEAPDWLSGLGRGQSAVQPGSSPSPDAPQWLSTPVGVPQTAPLEAVQNPTSPDWLSGQRGEPAEAPSTARLDEPIETPDWLEGLGRGQPSAPATSIESLGASAQEQDDAVAWLESLAAKHGAKPEELVTDPNSRSDTPPEWVEQARAASQAQSAPPPVASIENLGASAQEQDDAVAWLESLAAKHGAKPEELVTDPNKRSETPPDWVQQARVAAESQPSVPNEATETPIEWSQTAQNIGEQFFDEFESPSSAASAKDETGMWLRNKAEKEKRAEESPAGDWMSDAAKPGAGIEPPAQEADLPGWLGRARDEPAAQEFIAQNLSEGDLSDWLSGLDEGPLASVGAASETPRDLPDWLSGIDSRDEESAHELNRSSEKEPAVSDQTEEPASVPVSADLPDWLKGVDTDSGKAVDELEGQASWPDQGVPETIAESTLLKPTSPSDWHPAEPTPEVPRVSMGSLASRPPMPKPKPSQSVSKEPVYEPLEEGEAPYEPPTVTYRPVLPLAPSPRQPVQPVLQRQAPAPAQAPVQKVVPAKKSGARPAETQPGATALTQAKDELDRGDIPTALEHYGKLIKKGKHLEETIHDLSDSIYRYPVEVGIWQTLGDAYMRANRLKEALEAYNKAEELIR